jgi:hypothetical protein
MLRPGGNAIAGIGARECGTDGSTLFGGPVRSTLFGGPDGSRVRI